MLSTYSRKEGRNKQMQERRNKERNRSAKSCTRSKTPRVYWGHPAVKQFCRKGPRKAATRKGPLSWTWVSNVSLQLRRLIVFLAVIGKVMPEGQNRWSFHSPQYFWDHIWGIVYWWFLGWLEACTPCSVHSNQLLESSSGLQECESPSVMAVGKNEDYPPRFIPCPLAFISQSLR